MAKPGRDFCLHLVLSAIASGLLAQAGALPPSATPDYSKEGVVVEQLITRVTFENDGTGSRSNTVRIRVQSDAGVQKFGLLTFSYQASVESIDVTYVRVHKADGSVVVTPPENFQDMASAITRDAPFYSDVREKHVAVKGLSPGDLLEYECHWQINKPLAPGHFWFDYEFNDTEIVLDEQLELRAPLKRPVKFKSSGANPTITNDGNYQVYTWKRINLKSKVESDDDKTEKLVRQLRGRLPQLDVRFSSFQSWEELGRWYSDLQKERVWPTPEIEAKAAELTKSAADESAKLKAIYHYVSTEFRYIGIDFGIGRYQPHSAAEVLSNQYGDCKDKHTLFAALLAAAGIKAYPALIDIYRDVDADVPSPSQFDHVISVVPHGHDLIWLDTTPEVAPFGFLFTPLLGKHALVMVEDKPATLISTPSDPPSKALTLFQIDAKLDESGTLEGKIERQVQGDAQEVLLRQAFRRVSLAQWKDLMQQISYQSGFSGDVSDVSASSPEATDTPLHFAYNYKRKDYPDWANRRVGSPLPPILLPPPRDKEKKNSGPIWLGSPQEVEFRSSLELPKGYKPELPAPIHLVHDYAEYHAVYKFEDGKLIAERRLAVKLDHVPAAEEDDYKEFQKMVVDDRDAYVPVFSQDLSPEKQVQTSAIASFQNVLWKLPPSANLEANGLESEARNAAGRQDMTGAIAPLERAVALDPKFARGWLMLGTIYMAVARRDAGVAAFHKAIAAEPDQAALYKVLGFNLMEEKKYEDAAKVWRELIEKVPNDKDGPANLGSALLQLKQYSDAAKALTSAVELNPQRPFLRIQLGTAYLKAGMDDKGLESFHKALEGTPDPAIMNEVGYALADMNKDLPEAMSYAEKAVQGEEQVTRNLHLSSLKVQELPEMGNLAAYWDTLGWAYFRTGNLAKAEKCLRAAWVLSQFSAAADHLGQVYEQEHKKDLALRMYQLALGQLSPHSNVDASTIFERIKHLGAPPPKQVFGHYSRGDELNAVRTVSLPRLMQGQAIAEYFVLLSPGPKVEEVKFISGSEKLKSAGKALQAAKFDTPFPDDSDARLVRRGVVSCYPISGCSFVLLTLDIVKSVD